MKALYLGLGLGVSMLISSGVYSISLLPPQPTACIQSAFSSQPNNDLKSITLKLTNKCNKIVDFQNTTVSFQNKISLDGNFEGKFDQLSFPDNELRITSQARNGSYWATFQLHFPNQADSNSKLAANKSIQIQYNAKSEGHIGQANVYLNELPNTANIELSNTSAKPANVLQDYALIHLLANGQSMVDVQLPWNSTQTISGLAPGSYNITTDDSKDSSGTTYQGSVTPAKLNLLADQTVKSTIAYATSTQTAKLALQLQDLPTELSGSTSPATVLVMQADTGSSVPVILTWGSSSTVSQLKKGRTYRFSTRAIHFNNYICPALFTPATLVANTTTIPSTRLTYSCQKVTQSAANFNIMGAPSTLSSLNIRLKPNDNTEEIIQTIPLQNGSGSSTALLTTGTVYNLASDPVANYEINFNPRLLTASANAIETIRLTPQDKGTPVSLHGQLKVCGTHLCDEHDQQIQLKGMSTHGIQWYGWQGSRTEKVCLTPASLDTLSKNWGASVIRISMYVQEDGYATDPAAFTQQVNQLIDEATQRGMYAIVDWHMLEPGDPNFNLARAKTFFTAIATAHKNNNNLLYEIANEPSAVNWSSIKSYAEKLIPVIRAIDPKTIIIVGTPAWSSLGVSDGRTSQDIINAPINATNIMYTFHFYAASHKTEYYNELDKASNALAIFVTEFGTQTYTGDGANDFAMSDKYLKLLAAKKISWTNWNYSDDFRSGAVWKAGTCSQGTWTDSQLKAAGIYIKAKIKA